MLAVAQLREWKLRFTIETDMVDVRVVFMLLFKCVRSYILYVHMYVLVIQCGKNAYAIKPLHLIGSRFDNESRSVAKERKCISRCIIVLYCWRHYRLCYLLSAWYTYICICICICVT